MAVRGALGQSATDAPLVSVVIPAYNEERLVGAAIGSVLQSRSPIVSEGRVEVIVADNASTDATASVARKAGAKIVHEPQRQIARARNAGAGAARGRYLIFLDADSEMHPLHLNRVVELLGSGRVIGGGAVIQMQASWDYRLFVGTWNLVSILGRMAAGSFLFCERAVFESVGGFDVTLYAGEELSLSKKIKNAGRRQGKRLVVISDLPVRTSNRKIVDHTRWEVFRELTRLAVRGARGLKDPKVCRFWYPENRR